jgi:AcrR family transcriptional regulator
MPARSRPRRSQEERSALTRARILDATLDTLAERGYAGTTTTAVAERAGVSRGAQLHHFRTRQELLAAAVEHLYARLTETYVKGFARLSPDDDRIHAALALLWQVYNDPHLVAVVELQVAARTDRALLAKLLPVGERHHANVLRLAAESFPEAPASAREAPASGAASAAARPRFLAVLDLILDTLGGLRARALLRPDDPAIPRTLGLLEELARAALVAGEGDPSDA